MNAPCIDIANFLNNNSSLGLVLGTDLFYGQFPDVPDQCVCVFDNPGDSPMLALLKQTSTYFYSSVNVRVRHPKYAEGWQQMQEIVEFLHGFNQQNSIDNTAYYCVVSAKNDPQVLYVDKNRRITFFVHFEIQRKPI